MDLRALSDDHSVAPQLDPSDMGKLAEMGVTTVICNRPDTEIPPALQAAPMQAAADAAGMQFIFNPIAGREMSLDNVEEQIDAIDCADGPVVAYCATGTRCAIVWALAMAGRLTTDEIVTACTAGGYPLLDAMRGQIDAMAMRAG